MSEQNRKTLRSFYCRDYLWELFEVMASDLGCSMDYLINEAMRHYARSRNYSLATGRSQPGTPGDFPAPPPAPPGPLGGGGYPPVQGSFPGANPYGGGRLPTAPPVYDTRYPTQTRGGAYPPPPSAQPEYFPPPPPPAYPPGGGAFDPRPGGLAPSIAPTGSYVPVQPGNPGVAPPPPPPMPSMPPTPSLTPPGGYAAQPGVAGQPPLYLIFQGQKYRIDKEKFIIGRGSQITDLTIRDGNISRKHAAVIFRSGKYFIKDLDSTNGIDFQGSRIDSKKIEEGDVFHICDYELRFTYRA